MKELRDIPKFPGYSITRDGRVWSEPTRGQGGHDGKWLKSCKAKTGGYLVVSLYREKKRYYQYVHRLVLETFVEPRPDGMECRHLDGDPTNNHVENLQWGTRLENVQDSRQHGTLVMGETHGMAKLDENNVHLIRAWLKAGYLQREIAKAFGVTKRTVRRIKTGKSWGWLSELGVA